MDTFANRLAHAMESAEMRITDLSNVTGVSKGRISHWLKGENIPGKNLLIVSRALGVSPSYLLGQEEAKSVPPPKIHEVSVLGKVAAGVPISAQEDIIGSIWTDKECFALKIKGDSMSPRIMDGDIVLVKKQESAEDGDLVIAEIDGEATCKVLKRSHGSVMLVPFNAAFAPFVYTGQEAEDLRILGKVVESRHEW